MPKPLYLDTARLGQMSPHARRASIDFFRFASDFGGSMYLTDFLVDGFDAWPASLQHEFPGLRDWNGVSKLKHRLRHLGQAASDSNVVLASRSASLMKLATKLLFSRCRRVLVTDLTWRPYERILQRAKTRSQGTVSRLALRRWIFREQPNAEEVGRRIATAYHHLRCDGLFLPLVDCYGVRLPVEQLVHFIRRESELKFVAVDGAQAINHVPLCLDKNHCDFLIAGCHKWMRSFTPMAIGYFGRPETAGYIRESCSRWIVREPSIDPLLSFSNQLENHRLHRFGESVAVSPIITANAAAADSLANRPDPKATAHNRSAILNAIHRSGRWQVESPGSELRSRIMMLRANTPSTRDSSPDALRQRFERRGIIVSAYSKGRVRISLPSARIGPSETVRIRAALTNLTNSLRGEQATLQPQTQLDLSP